MAKTYILEPTELEFTRVNKVLEADLETTPLYGLTKEELKNLIPDGAILDINNGDRFITASNDQYMGATRDGVMSDVPPEEYVSYGIDDVSGTIGALDMVSTVTTEPGTYTVSIYTEGGADPYPVKNFTYEHAEVAKNDIEDIIQAAYTNLKETESQEAYGHSPADRLVIAVSKLFEVDPDTALTTGNYPNQMKRIAAIIRGDFNQDYEEEPEDPTE